MSDPRLDRKVYFDERSKKYNVNRLWVRGSDQESLPRSYKWGCGANLDQQREGACVAFSWTHERAAKPKPDTTVTNEGASAFYQRIREIDRSMGNVWDDGASVLAGAKAAVEKGWMTEYRWAFTTIDALTAISRHGPAVIGVWWWTGMMDPDPNGFLHVTGQREGGHAILVRGINVKRRLVVLHNSWGVNWGGTEYGPGTAKLMWEDFDKILQDEGECCVPVVRK